MRFVTLSLVAALAACTPSINPQMQSATDGLLASMKAGSHDEPVPSSYKPMEWAVGQWVAFKVTLKEKPPTVTRIGVVAKDSEGFWVETDNQDYYHHTISKVLYSKMPMTADEAVDFMQKIVTKVDADAAQTQDFSAAAGPVAGFTKGLMKSYAAGITCPTDVSAMPKEDLTVPAGSFKGTARYPAKISMGPLSKDVTSWFHPAVPLGGVRAVTTDGEVTYELLDYGLTGAKSAL